MTDDDRKLAGSMAGLGALIVSLTIGAVLSPYRDVFGPENATILYMAVVAVAAAVGGLTGGLTAAAVAALSYNFFFTSPYHTLRIDSTEQVVTVLLLFSAGVVTSAAMHAYRSRVVVKGPHPETVVAVVNRVLAAGDTVAARRIAVDDLCRIIDARWVGVVRDGTVLAAAGGPSPTLLPDAMDGLRVPHIRSRPGELAVAPLLDGVLVVAPAAQQPLSAGDGAALLAVAYAVDRHPQLIHG